MNTNIGDNYEDSLEKNLSTKKKSALPTTVYTDINFQSETTDLSRLYKNTMYGPTAADLPKKLP